MSDLAQNIAEQARELWAHFPLDEVPDDDEQIAFKLDSQGNLLVIVLATNVRYSLRQRLGWRMRPLDGDLWEISCWQHGELCERAQVRLPQASDEG